MSQINQKSSDKSTSTSVFNALGIFSLLAFFSIGCQYVPEPSTTTGGSGTGSPLGGSGAGSPQESNSDSNGTKNSFAPNDLVNNMPFNPKEKFAGTYIITSPKHFTVSNSLWIGWNQPIKILHKEAQKINIGEFTFNAIHTDTQLIVLENGIQRYRFIKNSDGSIRFVEFLGDLEWQTRFTAHPLEHSIAVPVKTEINSNRINDILKNDGKDTFGTKKVKIPNSMDQGNLGKIDKGSPRG